MQTLQSEFTSIPVRAATAVPSMVTPNRVPLWRLHGAIDDLVCAAVVTSYGYALCLEVGGEPILLELQRSLELLTTKASRLETWLLAFTKEVSRRLGRRIACCVSPFEGPHTPTLLLGANSLIGHTISFDHSRSNRAADGTS